MTTEQTLQLALESMAKVNEQQSRQIVELTAEVRKLTAQIAWFQKQMFGRKSEKNIAIDSQPSLFDAAGVEIPPDSSVQPEEEPEKEEIGYT